MQTDTVQTDTVRPNSVQPTAAVRLGYDSHLLAAMRPEQRQELNALANFWLVSSCVLGFPISVAVWQVEHSAALAFAAGLGTFLLVVNLLRLLVAGAGTAATKPLPVNYRPPVYAGVLIGGLALILSQPAQLMRSSPEVEQYVREHRQVLAVAHAEMLQGSGSLPAVSTAAPGPGTAAGPREPASFDAFGRELSRCEFVALRLKLLWREPPTAALWTALYVLFVVAPFLFARVYWLGAVQAYETLRHRAAVVRMHRRDRATEVAVMAALDTWPSYRALQRTAAVGVVQRADTQRTETQRTGAPA